MPRFPYGQIHFWAMFGYNNDKWWIIVNVHMIVDAHVHLGKIKNGPFATERFEDSLALLLREMKKSGIGKAIVIAGFADRERFNPATKHLLVLIDGRPNLYAIGSFDLVSGTPDDLKELEGMLKTGRIRGIKLYPGYQHVFPYDERCTPVYRLCLQYGVPVVFHAGDTFSEIVPNAKLKYSHPLHIDDVAADWPELKIVIAHMGNPWLIDCAELLYKHNNVYADVSGITAGGSLKSSYARMMKQRIRELAAYSDAGKLLYGTDWPLAPMNDYLAFVRSIGFSKKETETILYRNAIDIFGLA